MEGYWDVVVSSLQDICNANESISFDNLEFDDKSSTSKKDSLIKRKDLVLKHKENLEKTKRILDTALINVNGLLSQSKSSTPFTDDSISASKTTSGMINNSTVGGKLFRQNSNKSTPTAAVTTATATAAAATTSSTSMSNSNSISNIQDYSELPSSNKRNGKLLKNQKQGRSYYTSNYNPSEPIIVNSEVAFKPKQKHSEWIQCQVLKVFNEYKFEIKDPEPDDNMPNGQHFKCNWKEIIYIPSIDQISSCKNYPVGTKVLARYPETTTFYPAEVIGFTKNGNCRLKFEGEEEVGKETEVERRLVLPFPH